MRTLNRADDYTWHNVGLVDRENPALTLHCDLGLLLDRTTMTRVGVPVCDAHSRTLGMLYHFDYRPRVVSHHELLMLERIAPSLACYVATPHRAAAAVARVPWMRRRSLSTT